MSDQLTYLEKPCRSALNHVQHMGFGWSLNPYTGCSHRCTFCYVRAFERRADRPSDDRYGRTVRVKINVVEQLRAELSRNSWKRDAVVIGAATDPYQPAEGNYRLTRGCIRELGAARTPIDIITRGPMIIRDIDVLAEAARYADVRVNFSIPTLDLDVWRATEPGTAPPQQRLRAIRLLTEAGIAAGVGMAPILPGLSDRPEQLEAVVRGAREAGATHLWAGALHLKPGTREHFMECLARDFPELVSHYEHELYARNHYAPKATGEAIAQQVSALRARYGIRDRRTTVIQREAQLDLFGAVAGIPMDPGQYRQSGNLPLNHG